ncbi:MAG: PH domain-containing protein [Candidatus Krumholzibacteria bacterium]|nr:PH domain-containing protein [Candidatus Krumholzibacteria bacterium]
MSDEKAKGHIRQEIQHLLNEDQDPALVERICAKVKDILTSEEKIEFIAVQKKLALNPSPDAVVLTNRRFILYRPKIFGRVSFEDYVWRDLSDAHLDEGVIGATLKFKATGGRRPSVGFLPKVQARRLYAVAQEKEEKVREERRMRELEEKRAAAGGIVMHSASDETSADGHEPIRDPVERLKKLKDMLDAGLISPGEFESKRADIISKM